MNPSADGWIKKLLKDVSKNETYLKLPLDAFYKQLKHSGYIYGSNVGVLFGVFDKGDWTDEELCKVNHVLVLYYMYRNHSTANNFVEQTIQFYKSIEDYKQSFIEGIFGKRKSGLLLESIIHKRIHIDDNVITKNFNYFITNALLFIDVLAFQKHLTGKTINENYFKQMELAVETIALTVFELKVNKSEYDKSLIKLFEVSLRYQPENNKDYKDIIVTLTEPFEKLYALDIACMAAWSDKELDNKELEFLGAFSKDMHLPDDIVRTAIADINSFYVINKDRVALLNNKNMVQSFYDNSSKMVVKLINRNSKRLLRELKESKELMALLSKSTTKSLTPEEAKKVQKQLMDIIKSIPSLAIFMLPGGAILLPLFVKFIPKLLPSSFDENRIED